MALLALPAPNAPASGPQRAPATVAAQPGAGTLLAGCPGGAGFSEPPAAKLSQKFHGPSSGAVDLPADEAPHHQAMEWWYFSGHLRGVDTDGHVRCYGFEYVTFQVRAFGDLAFYLGNLAITDLYRHSFHYAEEQASKEIPDTPGRFSLSTGDWAMSGKDGRDTLRAQTAGYHLNLSLRSDEPAVLEGNNGQEVLGPFGSSKYYSWTSLVTGGTVVDHGQVLKVTGLSWMDHQWGPIDLTTGAGWDWFAVQLSDGTQYMMYFIRDKRGHIALSFGTRVRAGKPQRLRSLSESAYGTWKSPYTAISYSAGWRLSVPGGHLDVQPDLADQELDFLKLLQHNAYWEGDVTVSGDISGHHVSGVGYTELNPVVAPALRSPKPASSWRT